MTQKFNEIINSKLPLTRIQKLIGKLMMQSKRQMPCCYLETTADLTELISMRKAYCKAVGIRVTTNDFFLCAIARSMVKYPRVGGSFDDSGENIYIPSEFGVGLAVAAAQGLVVPVVKDVGTKTLPEIAEQSNVLVKRARANKLSYEDFNGANIVLSSLGMYGITSFFAIAPTGSNAIISIGNINNTIVPIAGDMMLRKTMSISLAINNALVDDFYAAGFMSSLVNYIENPHDLTEES